MMLWLRPATSDDAKLLFEWANDPLTRANAFNADPIRWEDHCRWLDSRLADPTACRIFIGLEQSGGVVGQIRFDREESRAVVDFSVAPGRRGKGFGTALLRVGCRKIMAQWPDIREVVGAVKTGNHGSCRAFEKTGFYATPGGQVITYTLRSEDRKFLLVASRSWYHDLPQRITARIPSQVELITQRDELTTENLAKICPLRVFIPHWSWKIPREIYGQYDCTLFHMTALPFGRGGSPLQNLIVRGLHTTKLSAIRVVEELDAGEIYLQRELSLDGAAHEIFTRAATLIEDMIVELISTEGDGVPQKGEPVIFRRRKPEESSLQSLESLEQVYDHIRMLDADGYPHAFIEVGKFRFEFVGAVRYPEQIEAKVAIRLREPDE